MRIKIAIPAGRGDRRRRLAWVAAPALSLAAATCPGRWTSSSALRAVDAGAGLPAGEAARRAAKRRQRPGQLPLARRSSRPSASTSSGSPARCGRSSSAPATPAASGATGSRPRTATRSYFGGADELQLRARGWRPAGTLHYVNVSGHHEHRRRPAHRRPRGDQLRLHLAPRRCSSREADAAPTRPDDRHPRRVGRQPAPTAAASPATHPRMGTVKAAVIHHTVTANDYTEAEAPGIVLGICRYHRNANGWNDIGYKALVDRFGNTLQGRAGGLRKAGRSAPRRRASTRRPPRSPRSAPTPRRDRPRRRQARSSTTSPGSSPCTA